MQVAVVGAGINGVAAAWALARGGHEVTLYEQFELGHTRGSSHGASRIFRLAYPDPDWVRFAEDALRGWRELERESGVPLLELHGLLELVERPEQSSRDALDACGAGYELLDAASASARWPIGVPAGWTVLLQPQAGIVHADRARHAFLEVARRHGAELRERTRIDALDEVDGDIVVVAAGAWARGLLAGAGIDLPVRPTRETVVYFRRAGQPLPAVSQLDPRTRGHAIYSLHDPAHGLKAGAHRTGPVADPDEPGKPDPALVERVVDWVRATYTDVDPEPVAAETCLYTNTMDESFVLERHGRVVVGSACSGHGFKFAPAVGERLATLAAG